MRVRFAPSPTGALHIGGARTALYNWLLARGQGGTLVLRIEDTDRARSTPENVEQIFDALRWLNLDFDEGPIFQSERADRHAEVVAQLLASGHAYHSNATTDDVRAFKDRHGSDRGFRGEPEASGAVRLRVPDTGETIVRDIVRGEVAFPNASQDDPVIARADGTPVYNLAVAVDDLDAGITHVVRGEDHISNTPKQMWVLEALGRADPRLRPPVTAVRPRRQEAVQAPRGRLRAGAARSRLPARGRRQLHRAAGSRLCLRRGVLHLAGAGRALPPGAGVEEPGDLRRAQAAPSQWAPSPRAAIDELTERLEAYTGRSGLRGAVEISAEKIQTLADFWPLVSFLFDGPVDDPAAFRRRSAGTEARRRFAPRVRRWRRPSRSMLRRSRRGCVRWSRLVTSNRARCSSRSGWRSRARPSRRESSRAWRCWGARRRWPALMPRSGAPAERRLLCAPRSTTVVHLPIKQPMSWAEEHQGKMSDALAGARDA